MTERTKRELAELGDPQHHRQELSPMAELGLIDLAMEGQRVDEHHCVGMCDEHAKGKDRGVGTPVGEDGPDPVDTGLERMELGRDALVELEPVDTEERLPDLF